MKESQKKWIKKQEQRRLLCEIVKADDRSALYYEDSIKNINPKHYKSDNDVIKFCLDNSIGFCEGNVIKYVRRWKEKNGVEDLLKAKEYLDRLVDRNKPTDFHSERRKKMIDGRLAAINSAEALNNGFDKSMRWWDMIDEIKDIIKTTPNNTRLGEKIRGLFK